MKLDCVLVACNENQKYLSFWPLVKKAWTELFHIPVILIYVAKSCPEDLRANPDVLFFEAIASWPTATQAQCIRLLYGALLPYTGAVLISDMDMIPLQTAFFLDKLRISSDHEFVLLRGFDEAYNIVYMCYVAATPAVWSSLFHITSEQDIRTTLQRWSSTYFSDGKHAGEGWGTDQDLLYRAAKAYPHTKAFPNCPIRRLDRGDNIYSYSPDLQRNVRLHWYVDFHMPDCSVYSDLLFRVLDDVLQHKAR